MQKAENSSLRLFKCSTKGRRKYFIFILLCKNGKIDSFQNKIKICSLLFMFKFRFFICFVNLWPDHFSQWMHTLTIVHLKRLCMYVI